MLKSCAVLVAALLVSSPAWAGKASAWVHTDGGSIRIVTEAAGGDDGVLRGALQIMLKPGWKTYWADPGDSGIPPSVQVTGTSHVGDPEIGFPPPRLIDDGYSEFAGYDRPVTLALSFPVGGDMPAGFGADIFLGICETICIPVQASLAVKDAPNGLPAEEIVRRAFSDLPQEADKAFHARLVEIRDGQLIVETEYPEQARTVELHVMSAGTRMIGTAEHAQQDSAVFFVPFTDTDEDGVPEEARYVLGTDVGSVTGTLRFED
ncbi:MAG: protein-disulfide reductase DsbD domain-containing protein [Rhizobiaceae bacterium]